MRTNNTKAHNAMTNSNTNTVTIGSASVSIVEYNGQRVITFKMMDELHGRPEGTARKRFNDNKDRLTEGEDYWKVCASEIRTHKIVEISAKSHEDVTLLTEAGYSMLVKSFTDDLAWRVQKALVRSYFRPPVAIADETPEEIMLRALTIAKETVDRQKSQIAELSPKAAALDAISEAEGDVGVRDAGRELGVGQTKVSTYLIEHKWACREGRKMRPAHYGLSQGYVRLVQKTYPDRHTGETCVSDDFKITRRGLARLAILLCGTNSEPARRLNGMKEKAAPVPFAKTPAKTA